MTAGQIVLVDWRGGALPKEPNKVRPGIVVEDDGLFDESFPNVLIVPLTESDEFLVPSLTVTIEPTRENGCSKRFHAMSHSVSVTSKLRIVRLTPSRITTGQLNQIRSQIAECIGFRLPHAEMRP